ncbi:MAG: hypothetical protein NTW25_04510 [Candidatus Kapabacteria bacterium]|nr:hypothetical protein [Candidatus Kapabacteria bacterium]
MVNTQYKTCTKLTYNSYTGVTQIIPCPGVATLCKKVFSVCYKTIDGVRTLVSIPISTWVVDDADCTSVNSSGATSLHTTNMAGFYETYCFSVGCN